MNPMEQARAFERLSREFHMTQEQMAVRTGKDRATVANFLRLLRLPVTVQERVESGTLSFGHARTLLALGTRRRDGKGGAADRWPFVVCSPNRNLCPGAVASRAGGQKRRQAEPSVDPNVREVQERLQRSLGLKVSIEDRNGRGKVIIEYAKLEDFDTLLELLAGD